MDLTGEYRIAASRERVWAALNDPEILKAAIPGCNTLDAGGDDSFTATVTAKVGPVKAKFQGQVTLSDMDPPNGYTIQGEGKGGAAGFAKGGAKVRLEADGDGTILRYEVEANVGGKWGEIATRMSVRYLGVNGPDYLAPTLPEPRWLIFVRPEKMVTWQGVDWAKRYKTTDWG